MKNDTLLLLGLACGTCSLILVNDRDCAANEPNPNVTFEIILDERTLQFPDPIYGYLRIHNASQEKRHVPVLVPVVSARMKVSAECGDATATQAYAPGFGGTAYALLEPGESRSLPFVLNYGHRAFVSGLLSGCKPRVHAEVYIPPTAAVSEEGRKRRVIGYQQTGEFSPTLAAPVSLSIGIDDTIASDDGSELARRIRKFDAWPEEENMLRVQQWDPNSEDFYIFHAKATVARKFAPVLLALPQPGDGFLEKIDCQSATWRSLVIRNAIVDYFESERSLASGEQAIDEILDVLYCAGRAETHVLLKHAELLLVQNALEHHPSLGRYMIERTAEIYPQFDYRGLKSFDDARKAAAGRPGVDFDRPLRRESAHRPDVKQGTDGGEKSRGDEGLLPCPCGSADE